MMKSISIICLACSLSSVLDFSQILTRHPYIQLVGANTFSVAWKTNTASNSKVEYGLTTSYGAEASDATLDTLHFVTVPPSRRIPPTTTE